MAETKHTLDCRGRPIMPGDVIKVFHFVGARGKRCYMYKQALQYYPLKNSNGRRLKISHLNRVGDEPWSHDHWYCEAADDKRLAGYEIIQSVECDHDKRAALSGADAKGGVDV